jgi:hypothetical protein
MTLVISKGITLDNGTRAAAIAGVSPTLDYRFAREKREIETVSLTDKLTFTGGDQATFVGSDGFIQRATTNVPRFDHDPVSRQSLGLLSEVERTNLLLRSEELQSSWILLESATVAPNTWAAPNGQTTGDVITLGTNSVAFGQDITVLSLTSYALSFYLNTSLTSASFLRLRFAKDAGASGNVWFSPSALTFSNYQAGVSDGQAVLVAANVYRISASMTFGATDAGSRRISIGGTPASGSGTSDVGKTIAIWGAQLEAASTPSTYIPTTSAAVTRTADSAVIDGTGVITGTYTMVEKPAGCAVVSGSNIELQPGFTAERVMVFPAALDAGQITAIRGAM